MFNEQDFFQRKPEEKKTIKELYEIGNNTKKQKHRINTRKKFLNQTLYELNSEEKNSYLQIMLNDLVFYKHQRSQSLSKKSIDHDISSSDNLIYNFLEKYLMEISYIIDKEKRGEKIIKLYQWYKEKKKLEEDMKTINYKSYKDENEAGEKEQLLMKSENELKTYDADDADNKHRNMGLS